MRNIFAYKIFVLKYFRGSWQLPIIKLTKCILYTNIRAFNFRGSPAPQKYFNNEHFPNYGISSYVRVLVAGQVTGLYVVVTINAPSVNILHNNMELNLLSGIPIK